MLFDGLFAEIDKFADWLASVRPRSFSRLRQDRRASMSELERMLTDRGGGIWHDAAGAAYTRSVTFLASANDIAHNDFMARAWAADPFKGGVGAHPGFCTQRPCSTGQAKVAPLPLCGRML